MNPSGDRLALGTQKGRSRLRGHGVVADGEWLVASGWWHVEADVFDVAGFVEAHQALGEGFDLVL